ncbi:glycosyltransferase family 4 protein [Chitinophaga japonensis]|uniref:Glycosyltransferase involved in cell wall biosynthesis n=1 Tax=Chitinophaga japonensis TaxID=104662 RepID=A0A562TD99_CHIJA|nr:glycosyltransferase family 1 protein [Chitinophaga japonensis]TWI91482.1 glycosyltransferase involved in cell wall biosynthesis [Chitinophaga japonensis]
MKQLLIDCEKMKNANTGLFTYCNELGNALLQQVHPDEQLNFYLPPKLGKHFGNKVGYLWQRSMHKLYLPHRRTYDIWHTTYQLSGYRSLRKGTKRVLTIHDLNFMHEDKTPGKRKMYLAHAQRNVNRADYITFISKFVGDDVLHYLDVGNKPCKVVYNGATVKEFPGFDQPCYRPQRPFLFTIGVVMPKKNFHTIPCLLQHNDTELIIAGTANNEAYKQRIMEEAKRYGAADRVKLLGAISEADKYWYLKNCRAFVFPSIAEGFGIPPIEAMHFGKPVFLSDKTSLPEVGGCLAYYFRHFEPAHMQQVFEEGMAHYVQQQPAGAIITHARQFSWERMAADYLEIYRSLY